MIKLKGKINDCLDKMKFKNIKKCKALVYDRKCNEYTKNKNELCDNHIILKREFCKSYHFFDMYQDIDKNILAEVEINTRNLYTKIYDIKSDYGHDKWLKHLSYYVTDNNNETFNFLYYNFENDLEFYKKIINNYNLEKEVPKKKYTEHNIGFVKFNIKKVKEEWFDMNYCYNIFLDHERSIFI